MARQDFEQTLLLAKQAPTEGTRIDMLKSTFEEFPDALSLPVWRRLLTILEVNGSITSEDIAKVLIEEYAELIASGVAVASLFDRESI